MQRTNSIAYYCCNLTILMGFHCITNLSYRRWFEPQVDARVVGNFGSVCPGLVCDPCSVAIAFQETTGIYLLQTQNKSLCEHGICNGIPTRADITTIVFLNFTDVCVLVTVALIVRYIETFNWQPHPQPRPHPRQQRRIRRDGGLQVHQPQRAARPQRVRRPVQRFQIRW